MKAVDAAVAAGPPPALDHVSVGSRVGDGRSIDVSHAYRQQRLKTRPAYRVVGLYVVPVERVPFLWYVAVLKRRACLLALRVAGHACAVDASCRVVLSHRASSVVCAAITAAPSRISMCRPVLSTRVL